MKRAEALRPLSRDHLKSLLAAKRLRDATDAAEAGHDFLDFWVREGKHHFRVEEEVLLPGWALHCPVDRVAVARMLEEHLAIRRVALRVAAKAASLEELQDLGRLLDDHVRFEERELFPMVEEALAPEDLGRLAEAIARAEENP
ncbi:MAG TPA: hemerythrin domain-containing protein [Solirubrobacterales bacterium]|nr:hemerythrin domain-containing protein [Solirubrobacterales bacterium]